MTWLDALHRFRALDSAEWGLFVRAFISLAGAGLGLHMVCFPNLVAWAERAASSAERELMVDDLRRARRYARRLDFAAHIVPTNCLSRSLALHRWLRGEGLPSELRIGVRKEGAELKAHAWVELAGSVVNDRRAAVLAFTPLSLASGEAVRRQQCEGNMCGLAKIVFRGARNAGRAEG